MRRLSAIVALALIAACGGGRGADDAPDAGVVDRSRDVPQDVQAFLDRVADPDTLTFTATYDVLNKNGGGEHTVNVVSEPPTLTLKIDGQVVEAGDDAALSAYGIFSGFLADNPAAAIRATARRVDAGDAVYSSKQSAGVRLDCISIPVQGAQTSVACLTPDGIFGFVDNPTVRYEVTALTPTGS